MRRRVAHLGTAVQTLTVLPVPDPGWEEGRLARSAVWFPVVGLGVGLAQAVPAGLLGNAPWTGAFAGVLAGWLVTGGLHEDGLADAADGLGCGGDRARRLSVMADSRIGAHGTVALILSLGARVGALGALLTAGDAAVAMGGVVAAAMAGRAAIVWGLFSLPSARPEGSGALAAGVGAGEVAVAVAIAALGAGLLAGATGLLAALVGGAAAWALFAAARRRIGGQTGDVLGAGCHVAETATLCALAALA